MKRIQIRAEGYELAGPPSKNLEGRTRLAYRLSGTDTSRHDRAKDVTFEGVFTVF